MGALAQFTRGGIVEAVAARLIESFVANLESRLGAWPEAPANTDQAAAARTSPMRDAPANELNALHLFGAVLRAWLRRLFGRR